MKYRNTLLQFKVPIIVLIGLLIYSFFHLLGRDNSITITIIIVVTIIGSFGLFKETIESLLKKQFALDYIAIMAIVLALFTGEYLVAGILALMVSSGTTLEEYGSSQARKSLTALIARIPDEVVVWEHNTPGRSEKISRIKKGDTIYIRKGEVIALDGILTSDNGLTDESSLTGEPFFIDKIKGDQIRSGTVNLGDPIVIEVTKTEENSTYKKIIQMVEAAEEEKSPFIRLADRYSTIFTLITFAIAAFAYFYSNQDLNRVLAVLAVATPCPLIIATPIALLGGVNAAAKKRIIVKRLASLEILARITTLIFDKTGTITIGRPILKEITIIEKKYSEKDVLGIAASIERSSLHPLAKAIVIHAKEKKIPMVLAKNITEKVGSGISGTVGKTTYTLSKLEKSTGMSIQLLEAKKQIAVFLFEDEIRENSKKILNRFKNMELDLHIFTGDKKESTDKIVTQLKLPVTVKAECTPEGKQKGIETLKKSGNITAMVGDGINDAPALALADVGMVFSNEEQTAASEAADIVFLGGNFSQVLDSYFIAKRTIGIATQSILWGIGLSVLSMILASVGLIPPVVGAGIQEAIDVAVILNALRAARIT